MPDTVATNKKEIYAIITVGTIGFLLVIWRAITHWDGNKTTSTEPVDIPNTITSTNNIVEEYPSLITSCKDALHIVDCTIKTSTGDTDSLRLYRQKITSERNILTPTQLQGSCDQQLSYMMSLSGTQQQCYTLSTTP